MTGMEISRCYEIVDLFRALRLASLVAMPSKKNSWISSKYLRSLRGARERTFCEIRDFRNMFVFAMSPTPPRDAERWVGFLKDEIARLEQIVEQKHKQAMSENVH